jgi:hypothetical protein
MKYLGLVVVVVAACGASVDHIAVTPLPPNPTPDQRMWFWEAYRPRGDVIEYVTRCYHGCSTTKNKVIQLADGRVVHDPEDLAPLVAPDSRTLREAHRANSTAQSGRWWTLGGLAMIAGGLVLGADGNQSDDTTERNVGIGVMVVGLATAVIAGSITRSTVYDARSAAFAWYPHDLADNLHVCFNGTTVTPCELNTPGAPPPPPPRDPNLDQLRPR